MIPDLFGYSPDVQPKIDLERFCHDAIGRLGSPERIAPEALAQHFVEYFNIRHPVTFSYQKQIAKKAGIHKFSVIEMPERIARLFPYGCPF